jgi:hypothetical protein
VVGFEAAPAEVARMTAGETKIIVSRMMPTTLNPEALKGGDFEIHDI